MEASTFIMILNKEGAPMGRLLYLTQYLRQKDVCHIFANSESITVSFLENNPFW